MAARIPLRLSTATEAECPQCERSIREWSGLDGAVDMVGAVSTRRVLLAVGGAVLAAVMRLIGWDVQEDPSSSDFGRRCPFQHGRGVRASATDEHTPAARMRTTVSDPPCQRMIIISHLHCALSQIRREWSTPQALVCRACGTYQIWWA